ncbi:M1 family metallopeptidase [Rufibacter glacialis]|uniref:Aminopeptidase N n=1 Tax=Rufibacter glacialis TaxID=1259555 RepID=A0A5M8QEE0_9BACT|nr:M1 family metallopeptidase [Rufibacter glacialis]KAA6434407.1 M1 family metallopeptidase [Rufibacter glacialis]GGK69267.1 aminopeptidase [Rufibacter glacialis]
MDYSHNSPASYPKDPHSFADPAVARITHVDWTLEVDFQLKKIRGQGTYFVHHQGAPELVLDCHHLLIKSIRLDDSESEVPVTLTPEKPFLGQGLLIPLVPNTQKVHLAFETTAAAAALQWLEPSQTAGKKEPFLFTQSQAILARTWLPCQDSPSIRFTYTAQVKVPPHLLPLMSATNPQEKNASGTYFFKMEEPIPSYLLSLAVGDLAFSPVGERCGVYAEPATLAAAADEFADTEKMLLAAESLYGPYQWGRYDLLVLPPSFPFGGMENPKLTFATPTIIAGDRSLTSLVAHELAHSWSGNLVTNATWNDFWLNEGFTVYFERRIMEALYGRDYAEMLHTLGYQDLLHTLDELKHAPQDTCLELNLGNRDPDEGLTEIAYEKGNLFLRQIEKLVGRDEFDAFVNLYFSTFQFTSMDTASFERFLEKELLNGKEDLKQKLQPATWIHTPGIPAGTPAPESILFKKVSQELHRWQQGTQAAELSSQGWSTHEWLFFLSNLAKTLKTQQLAELDSTFHFTSSGNAEIQAEWFKHAIRHHYRPAFAALEEFLVRVGRRKFLLPLYKALLQTPEGTAIAKDIYQKARPNYHAVSTNSLDALL